MVLKPDQERVKKMIKETLTLLCKNGLSFDVHFSIEALIGVTLDDKDVFLVNINELIKSDKAEEMAGSSGEQSVGSSGEESSENDVSSDRKLTPGTGHKRKRHKRPLVKREPSHQDSSNEDEPNAKVRSDGQLGGELRVKKEAGNDSGSDQNVIVIKEELDDCWSEGGMQQDAATYGQYATDVPGTSQDQKFPSLSDVSLLPVESQDSSQVWSHAAAYATPGGVGRRMSRSSTTGSQLDPSQEVGLGIDNYKDMVHYPSRLPPTEKKLQPRRRCRVCYKNGVRRDSSYMCILCPEQPSLCLEPCFHDYHAAKMCPVSSRTTADVIRFRFDGYKKHGADGRVRDEAARGCGEGGGDGSEPDPAAGQICPPSGAAVDKDSANGPATEQIFT